MKGKTAFKKDFETFETFRQIDGYWVSQMNQKEPSSFNGQVNVIRYKVTIEQVEEPKEVYQERLQKLWDECDNHHHWQPLRNKAKQLGVELIGSAGTKADKSKRW